MAETTPAEAVNVAVAAPEGTVTELGVVRAPELDDNAMAVAVEALALNTTVQTLLPPDDSAEGVHAREETVTPASGAFKVKLVDRELAPRAAVRVAV